MRGATSFSEFLAASQDISIHAPHAGRDPEMAVLLGVKVDFNPRAPCGARLPIPSCLVLGPVFQSTRPMRGATAPESLCPICGAISIHAPHAGRDLRLSLGRASVSADFNPRAPCGARPRSRLDRGAPPPISIHAPHAGRDDIIRRKRRCNHYFNPRAPCGARLQIEQQQKNQKDFNPRAPCGARQQTCTKNHIYICDNRQKKRFFSSDAVCQSV